MANKPDWTKVHTASHYQRLNEAYRKTHFPKIRLATPKQKTFLQSIGYQFHPLISKSAAFTIISDYLNTKHHLHTKGFA